MFGLVKLIPALSDVKSILHRIRLHSLPFFPICCLIFLTNCTANAHFNVFKSHFSTLAIMLLLSWSLVSDNHLLNIISFMVLLVFFITHLLSETPTSARLHSVLKRRSPSHLSIDLGQFVSIGPRVNLLIGCIKLNMIKLLLRALHNSAYCINSFLTLTLGWVDSIPTRCHSFFRNWL